MRSCPACKEVLFDPVDVCPGCGQQVVVDRLVDADGLVGLKLGDRYELAEFLGEGAMGWVYRGVHNTLGSSVAVKIMKPQARSDSDRARRFKLEARAASRLNNPHIISTIDFGETPSGMLYLVTEFIRGTPLNEVLAQEGALELRRAVNIMQQILEAMEESHAAGVVHRDLKPDNVMITRLRDGEDFVKILDFGIAKMLEDQSSNLTRDGQLFGTPEYMAPEQIRSGKVTAAADIYAAGGMFFEMLAGRRPVEGDSLFDLFKAHLYDPPPRLVETAGPIPFVENLQSIIDQAMAKAPDERFKNAHEFRKALHRAARFESSTLEALHHGPAARAAGSATSEAANPAPGPAANPAPGPAANPAAAPAADPAAAPAANSAAAPAANPAAAPAADPAAAPAADPAAAPAANSAAAPAANPAPGQAANPAPSMDLEKKPGRIAAGGRKRELATARTAFDMSKVTSEATGPGRPEAAARAYTGQTRAGTFPEISRAKESAALDKLVQGQVSVVQLVGEAGIGKTTLARRAARKAQEQGIKVHWIEPDPSMLAVPWAPIRTAVARVLGIGLWPTMEVLRAAVQANPSVKGELGGLAELFQLQGPLADVEPDIRKCETLAALTRVLLKLPLQPSMFIFEDADAYDGCSLRSLARLANRGRMGNVRVLVVSEVPVIQNLPDTLVVEPGPVDRRAVSDALSSIRFQSRGEWPQVASTITETTRGNPLWIKESFRLAAESGTDEFTSLADVITVRVSLLPVELQKTLQAVAVLGRQASVEELRNLLDDPAFDVKHLDRLAELGFVEPIAAGPEAEFCQVPSVVDRAGPWASGVRLCHPLFVRVVREGVPVEVRQSLNQRALELREAQGAEEPVLAQHAVEAAAYQAAVGYLERAGDSALKAFDASGAVGFYRRGVDVSRFDVLVASGDPSFLKLNVKLGEAMHAAGDVNGAQVVFKSVLGYAKRFPRLSARIRKGLAQTLMYQNHPVRALDAIRRAAGDAIVAGDADLMTETYLDLGNLLAHLGDLDSALKELNEGLDLITAGGGAEDSSAPRMLWRLLAQVAEFQRRRGGETRELLKAVEWAKLALGHAERTGSLVGQARCRRLMAVLMSRLGMKEEAERNNQAALETLRRIGDRKGQAACLLNLARIGSGSPERYKREAYLLGSEVDWCEEV